MRLSDVAATILFVFIGGINLILAIAFNLVRSTLWEQLTIASNQQVKNSSITALPNVSSEVVPLLNNYTTLFWLLFLFSMIGAIITFLVGSHREEHEQYETPQRYMPR